MPIRIAFRPAFAGSLALLLAACGGAPDETADGEYVPVKSSSAGMPAGRIAAGERLANAKGAATGQSCIDCHGVDGNAPIDESYPKLGGQYADYLAHTLVAYRNGQRSNALMAAQAKGLDDQQISDLAAWFASRPGELTDLRGTY